MKLTLARFRDLSILTASGPVSAENFAILKAGIRKLFREGKNKIILELPDAENFPPEILREIASLNLTAAELSGQIVLGRIEPLIRMKIESFAKPPIARCFRTREDAVRYFHPNAEEDEPASTAPPSVATSSGNSGAAPAIDSKAEIRSHLPASTEPKLEEAPLRAAPAGPSAKEEIRNREIGDLNMARNRISLLESENASLREQLVKLVVKRRDVPDLPAAQIRIEQLKKQVDELTQQLNQPPAKK